MPGERVRYRYRMELVDLVVQRRPVAAALFGDDVDDDRLAQQLAALKHVLQRPEVVAGHRPGVLQAQALEDVGRLDQLFEALFEAECRLLGPLAPDPDLAQAP